MKSYLSIILLVVGFSGGGILTESAMAEDIELEGWPVNGATYVDPVETLLHWQLNGSAELVDHYKIYFSSDEAAVQNISVTAYQGDVDVNGTLEYEPDDLELDTQYYWRINTVLQNNSVVYGDVWEFTAERVDVPGIVVAHSPYESGIYLGSAGIAVLPNGDYIAKCDEFGPNSTEDTLAISRVYGSLDGGLNWQLRSVINGSMWSIPFVYDGDLYLLGVTYHPGGDTTIRRSSDGGWTWTEPLDSGSGYLSALQMANAPTSVIEHNNRVWVAMTDALGDNTTGHWCANNRVFLMSFAVGTDPLVASNWQYSPKLDYDEEGWFDCGWLEADVVVSPAGRLSAILRLDYRETPEKAAFVDFGVNGDTPRMYLSTGFPTFYGGCKNFTVLHDEESDLYWAMSNPALPDYSWFNVEKTRNTLALMSSPDLQNWTIRRIVLKHNDPEHVGFQYPHFVIEGDDILAAVRTAHEDGLGGPNSQHNSNFLMFLRIENFRDTLGADLVQHWKLDDAEKNFSGTESISNSPLINSVRYGSLGYLTTPENQQDKVLLEQDGATDATGSSIALNSKYDRLRLGFISPDYDHTVITPFTIAFWFKTDAISNYDDGPDTLMSTNTGQDGRWAIDLTGTTGQTEGVRLNFFHGGGTSAYLPGAINAGQWYHVALTRSSLSTNNYCIYLDGQRKLILTDTEPFTNSTDGVWVGRRPMGTRGFNGQIDDIRFYDDALSDLEIAALYTDGQSGKDVCVESFRPQYDVNGDCKVDINDFAEIAALWLEGDYFVFFSEWLKCGLYPSCF